MSQQRATQLIEAGLWLRLSGDIDGARRLFEQAVRLDPDNPRAKQLAASMRAPVTATTVKAKLALTPSRPSGDSAPAAVRQPNQAETSSSPAANPANARAHGSSTLRAQTGRLETDSLPTVVVSPEAFVPSDAATAKGAPPHSGWESESGPGVHVVIDEDVEAEVMDLVVEDAVETQAATLEELEIEDETRNDLATLLEGARDFLELDDHSGAMELILKAHQIAPNDPAVKALRQRSEQTLLAMYESKLGALSRRPRVKMKDDEIIWLNLDHRAGFVLAQIDGSVTLEDVFAVSGMSRLDTARILSQLLEEGVIA